MGAGRRWAIDFSDNSTSPSSRDIADPPCFTRASVDQDDSSFSYQLESSESMGNLTSTVQEFANDGLHDVDGWKYSASVQHYRFFSTLAAY